MKYRTIYLNRKSVFFTCKQRYERSESRIAINGNVEFSLLLWAVPFIASKCATHVALCDNFGSYIIYWYFLWQSRPPHLEQYSSILHIFEISFASRGMSVVHWEISSCCWGRNPNLPFETVYSLLAIHHSLIHTDKFFSLFTKINNSQQ